MIALRAGGRRRHRPVDLLAGQGPERRRRLGRHTGLAEHGRRHRGGDAGDARHRRRQARSRLPAQRPAAQRRFPAWRLRRRSTPSRPPGPCRGCWRSGTDPASVRERRQERTRIPRRPPGRRRPLPLLRLERPDAGLGDRPGADAPRPATPSRCPRSPRERAIPRGARAARRRSASACAVRRPPTGSAQDLLEAFEQSEHRGERSRRPPAASARRQAAGDGSGGVDPGGATRRRHRRATKPNRPRTAAAAPPFEAGDNPGPKPWAPIGIGLAAAAVALGSVLLLGRRFSW